jgi:hypothetical protein
MTACQIVPALERIPVYLQIDKMLVAEIIQIEDVLFSRSGGITPPVAVEYIDVIGVHGPLEKDGLGLQMIVNG